MDLLFLMIIMFGISHEVIIFNNNYVFPIGLLGAF